jgi:hypothetical protein
MRLHFSLRTFFVLVTLLAGFCYCWFVLPTVTAKRFIRAVAAMNYKAADQFFNNVGDRFIASSADKYWAFEAKAELHPITVGQLLSGRRYVRLQLDYFHLDQNVSSLAEIAATSFGLKSPVISSNRAAVIIDRETSFNVPVAPRVR